MIIYSVDVCQKRFLQLCQTFRCTLDYETDIWWNADRDHQQQTSIYTTTGVAGKLRDKITERFLVAEMNNVNRNECQLSRLLTGILLYVSWNPFHCSYAHIRHIECVCVRYYYYPGFESHPAFDLIQDTMFTWNMRNLVIQLSVNVILSVFWFPIVCLQLSLDLSASRSRCFVPTENLQKHDSGVLMPQYSGFYPSSPGSLSRFQKQGSGVYMCNT